MTIYVMVEVEVPDVVTMSRGIDALRKSAQETVEAALVRFGCQDRRGMSHAEFEQYPMIVRDGGVKVVVPGD